MLSQEFVLALLQASITGAGLVLAVYTLIVPLSRKIFGYRAEEIYEELQEFKERASKTDTRLSKDDLSKLKRILENVEVRRGFPNYLSWLVGFSFFFYGLSSLMSMWWILDWNKPTMDYWLPITFGLSTILFILIGILSIKDIVQIMKREFEELKEKVDEARLGTKPSVAT